MKNERSDKDGHRCLGLEFVGHQTFERVRWLGDWRPLLNEEIVQPGMIRRVR
jgi:hypothetical protein